MYSVRFVSFHCWTCLRDYIELYKTEIRRSAVPVGYVHE